MKPSADNIALGRALTAALGVEPHIYQYYDDDESHSVHILDVKDPVDPSIKIYATIGVSDVANMIAMQTRPDKDIRVELIMPVDAQFEKAGNILSTIAFYCIKEKWSAQPGSVFKWMVDFYYNDTTTHHVLFIKPFLWQDKLNSLQLPNKEVHFLMALPITNDELALQAIVGSSELERRLMEAEIDLYNLNRPSIKR